MFKVCCLIIYVIYLVRLILNELDCMYLLKWFILIVIENCNGD